MGALLGMMLYLHGAETNTEQVWLMPSLGRPIGLPALAMPLHHTAMCPRVFAHYSIMPQEAPIGSPPGHDAVPAWCRNKHRAGLADAFPGQTYWSTCTGNASASYCHVPPGVCPLFYNATGGPYMGALLGMMLYLHGAETNTEQVWLRPSPGRPTDLPALAMPLHYTAMCPRVFSPLFYNVTGGPYVGALLGMMLYLHVAETNTEQVWLTPSLGRPTGLPALAMPLQYTAMCPRVFSPPFYNATGGPYVGALLGMMLYLQGAGIIIR